MNSSNISQWPLWFAISLLASACSSSDVPQLSNQNDSTDFPLEASIIAIDDEQIQIRYSLSNNTDADRIVFDIGGQVRTSDDEGELRLFKGQYDPDVSSLVPLLILGQILPAGESVTEDTGRDLPITIDFDFAESNGREINTFEFCIGHSDPSDQTMADDPDFNYFLRGLTPLSRNECVMLTTQ